MIYTLRQQDLEQREILADLASDTVNVASIVTSTQPGLTSDQRAALLLLVKAAKLVCERLGTTVPKMEAAR